MKNTFEINEVIQNEYKKLRKEKRKRIVILTGDYGVGKTNAALSYCLNYSNSLYFSFKNIDATLAPKVFAEQNKDVFSGCNDWNDFFKQLENYAKRKIPVVFFDDFGDRNDKDEFLICLEEFLNALPISLMIVLMIHTGETVKDLDTGRIDLKRFNPVIIRNAFSSLSEKDSFRLCSLTDGYYDLLKLYDEEKSFEENIKQFLNTNSCFYRFAIDYLNHFFRAPESYNALLYGMAIGHNTISGLSDFTGFPRNKCDKYLKALQSVGLVRKAKDKNNHSVYGIKNNYFKLWYKYLYSAKADVNGDFDDTVITKFKDELENSIVPDTFSNWCRAWISNSQLTFCRSVLHTGIRKNQNLLIGGIHFDYAEFSDGKFVILKTFNEKPTIKDWEQIEKASLTLAPFYEIHYVIGTMADFIPYFWNLNRQYDNVHFVRLRSLNIDSDRYL